MRIQNKKFFASILFVLISFVCLAQSPGGGIPPPSKPPPPPGLPIDHALPFLVVAGLFYGVKKKIES
jgi:hypothetical protein